MSYEDLGTINLNLKYLEDRVNQLERKMLEQEAYTSTNFGEMGKMLRMSSDNFRRLTKAVQDLITLITEYFANEQKIRQHKDYKDGSDNGPH